MIDKDGNSWVFILAVDEIIDNEDPLMSVIAVYDTKEKADAEARRLRLSSWIVSQALVE